MVTAVSGVLVGSVATPGDTAEVAAVLRDAAAAGQTVVPRGSGSKLDWGGTPSTVDIVLDLSRLSGVPYHAPADLVATVWAGTPLAHFQSVLAEAGQRLSLSAPSTGATIGGVLSTGEAGPLRLRHGTGRDLLIGAEFVRADGIVARAGGRVVKNVAGYDVGKLLCGAYGTLGVLTSATFRLHPLPAARAWVCRSVRTPLEVSDLVGELLNTFVEPSAVEVDLPGGSAGQLAVLLEGTSAGVPSRASATRALLAGDASTMDGPPAWWDTYPFTRGDVGVKIVAPVADAHAAVYALHDVLRSGLRVRGSAGTGVLYAALPRDTPVERVVLALDAVRDVLLARDGSAVVLTAPPAIRDSIDLWGPVPALDLMRRVKERFDPARTLSPGRFVGGI